MDEMMITPYCFEYAGMGMNQIRTLGSLLAICHDLMWYRTANGRNSPSRTTLMTLASVKWTQKLRRKHEEGARVREDVRDEEVEGHRDGIAK